MDFCEKVQLLIILRLWIDQASGYIKHQKRVTLNYLMSVCNINNVQLSHLSCSLVTCIGQLNLQSAVSLTNTIIF